MVSVSDRVTNLIQRDSWPARTRVFRNSVQDARAVIPEIPLNASQSAHRGVGASDLLVKLRNDAVLFLSRRKQNRKCPHLSSVDVRYSNASGASANLPPIIGGL